MIELSRISEAKRQIRLQAWTDMYREFLASGKTIKAWCEENGIARTTFHNRLKQIREAALETKHEIVPVNAEICQRNPAAVDAELIRISGGGITAELPRDISPELLATLLKGLSSC